MGREDEPQQYVEKSKFLNWLDEAFDFMCIHMYRDLLFHLEGLDLDHHSIWIIITRSSSSLDHHLIWIITTRSSSLDHYLIWIITEAGSSSHLDRHLIQIVIKSISSHLDHLIWIIIKSGSSSQLDRHLIWIVIKSGSTHLDHHQVQIIIICYLTMVLSQFFSSQEVLQSQSCRPTLHVGLHQRLYLTLKSEWPAQLLHLTSSCQKGTPNTHI